MDEPGHLLLDSLDHARRAMTQKATAPTRKEIEVAVARIVPDRGALAAIQDYRVARVVADDELLKLFQNRLAHGKGPLPKKPRRGSAKASPSRSGPDARGDQVP